MLRPSHIVIFIFIGTFATNASENPHAGARAIALSNAFVSVSDTWSTFHNQAGLATFESFSAGVFYDSKFMVEELSNAALTAIFPTPLGIFGLSYYQRGKAEFKEGKIGLAYAKQLSEKINASLQFDYFFNSFPENDKVFGFPTFELGLTYRLNEEFIAGAHLFNPVKNGIKTYYGKEEMPLIIRIGGHYYFADNVLLSLEAQKASNSSVVLKTGLEFYPVKNLALRFGISEKPVQYTAGIGYRIGKISTDIAFSYHGNLGFTPSLSIHITY